MLLDCKPAYTGLDLAILIDCTGSMKAHVKAVESSITSLVRAFRKKNRNEVKLAVIPYLDFDVGEPERFNILPFTANSNRVTRHITQWCR